MEENQNANKLSFLDKVSYQTNNIEQISLIIIYSMVGFFLPFVLSHSLQNPIQQIIIGSLVNMIIILSAFHLKKWEAMPLMILPTFGVLAAAKLFGVFTWKLAYMMPFIWVGNFILFALIKKLFVERKMNYTLSLPISIIAKTALLFSVAFIFVQIGALPVIFLTAMGVLQIVTALIGGAAAYGLMKARTVAVKN